MQYSTHKNSRLYDLRRGSDLDFEVADDVKTLTLFPEIPKSPGRRDRDLPYHLQTREAAILECSPYFSDSRSAGRVLNRIGHKSKKYGFDGEAPKHIALVARLALGYTNDIAALQSIEAAYLTILERSTIGPRDNFDKVTGLLEREINGLLKGKTKRNPANLPKLL